MIWTTYARGYRSEAAALDDLDTETAEGRITAADARVTSYRTASGARRWRIEERTTS